MAAADLLSGMARGNQMRIASVLVALTFLMVVRSTRANTPPGFTWVNLEKDKTTMVEVRRALQNASISAIREVGVEGGFAFVMATSRETDSSIPDYDQWYIYNVDLQTGNSRLLVFGYGVKLLDWIGPEKEDLGITYYDCWECEAAKIFTTLHFTKGVGWRARWPNRTEDTKYPQPGGWAQITDTEDGDEYIATQVFAVVAQPEEGYAAGNWYQTRNRKTGKVEDDVERYSIDGKTGREQVERLTGQAALDWERTICTPSNLVISTGIGQDSKACKRVLQTQIKKMN